MSIKVTANEDGTLSVSCGEDAILIGSPRSPEKPTSVTSAPITVIPEDFVLGIRERETTEIVVPPGTDPVAALRAANIPFPENLVLVIVEGGPAYDVTELRSVARERFGENVALRILFVPKGAER